MSHEPPEPDATTSATPPHHHQPGVAQASGNDSPPLSKLGRIHAALSSNRSKLWRTSPLRPVRLRHFLLLLLTLGLAWRVIRYALGFPIWGDEAFVAVNFLERDFAGMIHPLIYGQIVPLVFMWAELAASHLLGYSEWALRFLPFLAGIAALPLFWRFASTVLKPRAAFLAVGIFASAYYTVRHAAEIKPYSIDLLVSLGLMMLAWSVYTSPQRTSRWLALIALTGLSVWCSYPSVFVAGGVGLFLTLLMIRERRPAVVCGWLAFGVVLAGSFLWMYLVYARPHAQAAASLTQIDMWAKTFPPLTNPWKFLLWFLYMHLGNMLAYPVGGKAPGSILTFTLVVIGSVHLWRNGRRDLLLLLLGPLGLAFIAACLHKYPYGGSARTTQYLAPAFCMLTGLGLFVTLRKLLAGPRLAVSLRIAGAVLALIAVGGAAKDIAKPYKTRRTLNSQQAVLQLAQRCRPTDLWIIFNARDPHLTYAPFIGELRGTGAQFAFNLMRFCPGKVEWAPPPDSITHDSATGDIWLLAYHSSRSDLKKDDEFRTFERGFSRQLEAYLSQLEQKLGPPDEYQDIFIYERTRDGRKRRESLDAYRFSP